MAGVSKMSEQHEMDMRSKSPGSGLVVANAPKKHFEPVESSFFDQGEQPDFAEWQGILDEREKWYHLSYRSLVGVSIVSTALAFTSCLLLFRANTRSQPQGPATPTTAALPSLGKVPAAPAPPSAPSTAVAVAEAPKSIAPVTIPATVETPRPTVVVAAEPTTTTASPTKAIAAIFPAPSTATPVATTERGGHATAPVLEAEETHQHCRQSIRSRHTKDILATCAADFEADTTD